MTICQFFLQGRCRFGDRCWNEHPGARGAGGARQPPPQQQPPSGNNRRGWNASSQRYSNVIQPSSFPKSTPWGGSRDQDKPPFGSFDSGASTSRGFGSSQNPFASPLSDEQKDEKKLLEGIVKDVEVWESSGQWMFSVYSPVRKKPNISGCPQCYLVARRVPRCPPLEPWLLPCLSSSSPPRILLLHKACRNSQGAIEMASL